MNNLFLHQCANHNHNLTKGMNLICEYNLNKFKSMFKTISYLSKHVRHWFQYNSYGLICTVCDAAYQKGTLQVKSILSFEFDV